MILSGTTTSIGRKHNGSAVFEDFDRKRIDVGQVTINCVIGGSGPPLLMLHGFPQNLAMWARVAPVLARRRTVICADLRGYGDSSKPACDADLANYSFRQMAADQVRLMQALGFDRFDVVGHDRGGRTGHRMALDTPDVVRSLAVLDIVPTYAMFMETNRHVLLALVFPVAARAIPGTADRK
jgi:haloacetate dehalogenase